MLDQAQTQNQTQNGHDEIDYKARNQEIKRLHQSGVSEEELVAKFGISPARVWQIVTDWKSPSSQRRKALNKKIEDMEFSVRTKNALLNNNIKKISDLLPWTERDLLRMPNFGRKSLNEMKEVLEYMGIQLKVKEDNGNIGYDITRNAIDKYLSPRASVLFNKKYVIGPNERASNSPQITGSVKTRYEDGLTNDGTIVKADQEDIAINTHVHALLVKENERLKKNIGTMRDVLKEVNARQQEDSDKLIELLEHIKANSIKRNDRLVEILKQYQY
jgi:hypothetical protein